MALIRVYVTLERKNERGESEHETHADMMRDTVGAGLISDLENFWRVVRTVSEFRDWTPTLHICTDDRSCCVALRDPPFTPRERESAEHALTIFEALCKLQDAMRARVRSEHASARSERASVSVRGERASVSAASERASGTHARARASEPPQVNAERASGTHPHASAEHESDAHPRARSERASVPPPSERAPAEHGGPDSGTPRARGGNAGRT